MQRGEPNQRYGLGTSDNPVFPGMHEIAAWVAMASVEAARRVWTGDAQRACNISGGLHHAMPSYTSGFCVYNDVALAIRWLLDNGCERVGYVDVDVHHGDGVQAIFYDDPRVMTVSLHETPAYLFPGTGFPNEIGGRGAEGTAVNVALPPGSTDADWLRAFHAVVPQVLRAHKPSVLVTQHGCDSHRQDPLADLNLTLDGQRASYFALASLADELCGGRWVCTGGGGYAVLDVVPRAWTHLLGIVSGRAGRSQHPVPETWRAEMARSAPLTMSDGADASFRRSMRVLRRTAGSIRRSLLRDRLFSRARPRSKPVSGCLVAQFCSDPARRQSLWMACRADFSCICCTNSTVCHYSHFSTHDAGGEAGAEGCRLRVAR